LLNIKKMAKIKIYIFFLLLAAVTAFGQQKQVRASLDSTRVRIGSQFNLILKTTVDEEAKVNFPEGKNFGKLEVLESYPIDTVESGDKYELVKRYGLTQFDSGNYVVPSLPVLINNKTFNTDSLTIEVANIAVDTLKQKMYDIKPIATAKGESKWWMYLLALVGFAVLGYVIYWDVKRRKKARALPQIYTSPIEKATGELKRLENKQLLQKGAIKDYYSELTDIARNYIEEAVHIPAKESTTGGLMASFREAAAEKKMALSTETFEQLEKVLRHADMVKFAMERPREFEISDDRQIIEQSIVAIDNSFPVTTEEDIRQTEEWKEQQAVKRSKVRRALIIGVSAFLIIGGMAYIGFTKIYTSVQDNIVGHPTRELWEGEWVKSDYGIPPITIETPKVLKRTDLRAQLSKAAQETISDMQMFGYGAMIDNFYVMAGTINYMPGIEISVQAGIDAVIKSWEAQGAKNIITRQETYKNAQGIEGLRVFGSLSQPDVLTKEMRRCRYEILYFGREMGLQQIMIMHDDQDEYGAKIAEKIKRSIRFRTEY